MTRLEFELACHDVTFEYVNLYAMETSSIPLTKIIYEGHLKDKMNFVEWVGTRNYCLQLNLFQGNQ